jgi:hypothetical protein
MSSAAELLLSSVQVGESYLPSSEAILDHRDSQGL